MEILSYFKSVSQASLQIFFLGSIGFILARRKILSDGGVSGLSGFLIGVSLPSLIFCQIISKFSFHLYPDWWVFVLISLLITAIGLAAGFLFSFRMKDAQLRREFVSLTGFQNAGYLPLALLGWILPQEQLSVMLIYLFLFLMGFNLVIWSWGVYFLSARRLKKFSFASLFSPPVIAVLLGLAFIILKINRFLPRFIVSPLEMLGNCSFTLAMIVVGASLAQLSSRRASDRKIMLKLIFVKMVLLPFLGLLFISYIRLPYLMGLLIVLELAVPSANNLVVISRQYEQGEKIVSSGILYSHIAALITLPVFLALYNLIVSCK